MFISQIHLCPIKHMKYNHVYDTVVSADVKGVLEYWSPSTLSFPEDGYVFLYFFLSFYGALYIYIYIYI